VDTLTPACVVPSRSGRARRFASGVPLLCALTMTPLYAADQPTGRDVYQRHCVLCHGAKGEGSEENYPYPLAGDRSVAQLARFIAKSMPPDMPGTCSEKDAERVATYIFKEFYSREAQVSRSAPRIETARLTGRQYSNTIADLIVAFFGLKPPEAGQGLRGSYATIDAKGDGKQVFVRVDPEIRFDFGTSSPKPGEIDPAEFAISWTGSILAPATGEYEFIVRSPNSFNLFVNDRKTPLIDAWIKSGDQTEFRGTIRLLAGRFSRLQLNFTKAGQGAKKPEPLRARVAPAAISLAWKPPGRGEETIPARHLSPQETRETLVLKTAFPPDDRSTGFERGTTVSAEWDQATTEAAVEAATYVRERIGDFSGVTEFDQKNEAALRAFCARFAERAFRRPLLPEQRALYVDRPFQKAPDLATAVERVVLMVLKSPRFLYVDRAGVKSDDYATASRLSFTLWDSLPDDPLLAAAAAGQLRTRDQVAIQARRMTSDARFQAKLREFFLQWLKIDQLRELRKDAALLPEFNAAVAADLRTSLELFLEDVLHEERADFRTLLVADYLYLNERLGTLYGAKVPGKSSFQKFKVNPEERAGILSHPYLMAAFADSVSSSPIRRGVFITRSVLGRTLRPPPDAVSPVAPSLHPNLTTRERTALQTHAQTCQSCHSLINPLGFPLERFDALGRVRNMENQHPINAKGSYLSRAGELKKFDGARELAAFLAGSDEVHTAFIEKLFYYSVKQPIRALAPKELPTLKRKFVDNDYNIRRLMAEIATEAALSTAGEPGSSGKPNGN
jgi:mono/diheme cytochrome c family protein